MASLLEILESGKKDHAHAFFNVTVAMEDFTEQIKKLNREIMVANYYAPTIMDAKSVVKLGGSCA